MKKLVISILFVSSCFMLLAQTQSNDMDNLQKQVTAIKNSTYKQKVQLKQFIQTSSGVQDSVQMSLDEINKELKALSDTLMASKSQVSMLKTDLENTNSSLKTSNAIQYICLILILILLIVIFYILSDKTKRVKEQCEKNLVKAKEGLDTDLNKISKELKAEISSVKVDIQQRIDDTNKKIAAINK